MSNLEPPKPLISFCLFCFNQAGYIEEAVRGALSQTYMPLEIIISDDCSLDGTYALIEDLTRDYSGPHKIIINRNAINLGLAGHVNKVLTELASGEWFVTAAGDDISLPDRVEKTWAAFSVNPEVRGVHCAVERINETGKTLNAISPRKLDLSNIHRESMLGAAAAYHRDVVDLYGKLDDTVQNEDMVLSLRSLLAGSIVSIEDICVKWRRHGNNLSGRINASSMDQLRFLYSVYAKRRIFSSIQQLKDVLVDDGRLKHTSIEIEKLQLRLLRTIDFDWKMSRFVDFLLDKKSAPLAIKTNPKLWFHFISKAFKVLISKKLRSAFS